ncbi:hypothetical protein GS506_14190 [Rhodococcus hoagii]|nr:hypothetical protein [Prescottella equi]
MPVPPRAGDHRRPIALRDRESLLGSLRSGTTPGAATALRHRSRVGGSGWRRHRTGRSRRPVVRAHRPAERGTIRTHLLLSSAAATPLTRTPVRTKLVS